MSMEWVEHLDALLAEHQDPDQWIAAREIEAADFHAVCRMMADSEYGQAIPEALAAMAAQLGFEVARSRYGDPF